MTIQPVPFIDADHQCAPGFNDKAGNMRVLVGNVLLRIQQQDHDVGIGDRLQRLDH
ncbi:hypothetical protein D3C87_2132390 [compost metagenome]